MAPMSNDDGVPPASAAPNANLAQNQQLNGAPSNQAAQPKPVTNQNLMDYTAPMAFKTASKLRSYLAWKKPGYTFRIRNRTTQNEVLGLLRDIISDEKLYDERNASVILCDRRLETALNVKALHLSEIREHISRQLVKITEDDLEETSRSIRDALSSASPGQAESAAASLSRSKSNLNSQQKPKLPSLEGHSSNDPAQKSAAALIPNMAEIQPNYPYANSPAMKNKGRTFRQVMRPPMNKPHPAPQPHLGPIAPTDQFFCKPNFRKCLAKLDNVDKDKYIFTYEELTNHLSSYILSNKEKFFDSRNIKVAMVEGDELGAAFQVRAFHRSQVTSLLRTQIIKADEEGNPIWKNGDDKEFEKSLVNPLKKSQNIEPKSRNVEPKMATASQSQPAVYRPEMVNQSNSAPSRKRTNDTCDNYEIDLPISSNEVTPEIQAPLKRFRRKSSSNPQFDVIINLKEDSSSDDESIYSEQGYETVPIEEVALTSSEENETDKESCDDAVYEDEFELASDDDEDKATAKNGKETDSDADSELDLEVVIEGVLLDTDGCLAESESESNDTSDFELSNYDPEIGHRANETWKCKECGIANPWGQSYCIKCYQKRKFWVPERPKPKKRRNKKTKNQPIKGRAKNRAPMALLRQTSSEPGASTSTESEKTTTSSSDETKQSDEGARSSARPDFLRHHSQCSQDSGISSQTLDDLPELTKSATAPASQNAERLCNFCLKRDKDCGIIHGRVIHQVCCYQCGKRWVKRRQPCPICRRRIEKIAKIIMA